MAAFYGAEPVLASGAVLKIKPGHETAAHGRLAHTPFDRFLNLRLACSPFDALLDRVGRQSNGFHAPRSSGLTGGIKGRVAQTSCCDVCESAEGSFLRGENKPPVERIPP
jgi:hypothetical protein